jgi:hypothetical protein
MIMRRILRIVAQVRSEPPETITVGENEVLAITISKEGDPELGPDEAGWYRVEKKDGRTISFAPDVVKIVLHDKP